MNNRTANSYVSEIADLIHRGAERLLLQSKYSADYLLNETSEIAEANLVVHVASAFIEKNYIVWSELPFRNPPQNRNSRFDLSIDLFYEKSDSSISLKIEAKRIAQYEENLKVRQIIGDFGRMKSWRGVTSEPEDFPYHSLREIEWFYGAIAVILPENCDEEGSPLEPSFTSWWKNLNEFPPNYDERLLGKLRAILNNAARRDFVRGRRYFDGAGDCSCRMRFSILAPV